VRRASSKITDFNFLPPTVPVVVPSSNKTICAPTLAGEAPLTSTTVTSTAGRLLAMAFAQKVFSLFTSKRDFPISVIQFDEEWFPQ
jgi:hypothetical protein